MSIFSRRRMGILVVVGVVVALGFVTWHINQRAHVAAMLEIAHIPPSVENIDCTSFGVTDVLERCSFEVAPNDFTKLLAGHRYKIDKTSDGMSHAYCCGPSTGDDFKIDTEYVATPSDASYGGSIAVVTDSQRRQVMIDLYIE